MTMLTDKLLYERMCQIQTLFEPIRERFRSPGVERGGCVRHGLTPVYARKFGDHISTIFPHLSHVEASFNDQQLALVNESILALKYWITGKACTISLAERIVDAYRAVTAPYFVSALLHATEALLEAFIQQEPTHAPVMDALFCVAGGEGFRDLLRLYDARVLEYTHNGTAISFPDILAFVNIHERERRTAEGRWETQRYEVWCPGYDCAKEYHMQCVQAATQLVSEHHVSFVPELAEEVSLLPSDLVAHLTRFVHTHTVACMETYRNQTDLRKEQE